MSARVLLPDETCSFARELKINNNRVIKRVGLREI